MELVVMHVGETAIVLHGWGVIVLWCVVSLLGAWR